jgi:hypothetical protein
LIKSFLVQTAKAASLFVFRDSIVAYSCYQTLDFIETDYPKQSLLGNMQNCAYMVLSTAEAKNQFEIINLASL